MSQVEAKAFFTCPYGRCPVRFFPVEVGQICPNCGMPGVYAGIVAKTLEPTPEPED